MSTSNERQQNETYYIFFETPKQNFRNHGQTIPNYGNRLVVQNLNGVNMALCRCIKCPMVRYLWCSIRNWPKNQPCRSKVCLISIHWCIAPERVIANTIHIQLCHLSLCLSHPKGRTKTSLPLSGFCPSVLVTCRRTEVPEIPAAVASDTPWWWRSNGIENLVAAGQGNSPSAANLPYQPAKKNYL